MSEKVYAPGTIGGDEGMRGPLVRRCMSPGTIGGDEGMRG